MHRIASGNMHLFVKTDRSSLYKKSQHSVQMHRIPIDLRRAPLTPLFDKPAFSRLYQNCEQRIVVEIVGKIVKRLQNTQIIAFCSYRWPDLRFPCFFYRGLIQKAGLSKGGWVAHAWVTHTRLPPNKDFGSLCSPKSSFGEHSFSKGWHRAWPYSKSSSISSLCMTTSNP